MHSFAAPPPQTPTESWPLLILERLPRHSEIHFLSFFPVHLHFKWTFGEHLDYHNSCILSSLHFSCLLCPLLYTASYLPVFSFILCKQSQCYLDEGTVLKAEMSFTAAINVFSHSSSTRRLMDFSVRNSQLLSAFHLRQLLVLHRNIVYTSWRHSVHPFIHFL